MTFDHRKKRFSPIDNNLILKRIADLFDNNHFLVVALQA
jgi:hypothetical protein